MKNFRDYEGVLSTLKKAENVLLTTHKSPDGDAIGSILGLKQFLKSLGIDSTALVPDQYPHFLAWMPGTDELLQFDKDFDLAVKSIEKADVLVSLDYNVLSRTGSELGGLLEEFRGARIMIDHHREPDESFNHYIHDITSSSTAQLVFDFIEYTDNLSSLTLEAGSCLYAGILTDTGSFRFPSTSIRTHEIAGKLMQVGVDTTRVYNDIYDTNSLNRLKLLGHVLANKLQVLDGGKVAYFTLSIDELNQFHYQPGDTEGVVNYALSINGVIFACIMKEAENGTKLSFRSKGNWDVNQFARKHFNGGGHLNAAGGFVELSLKSTEEKFLEQVSKEAELS